LIFAYSYPKWFVESVPPLGMHIGFSITEDFLKAALRAAFKKSSGF